MSNVHRHLAALTDAIEAYVKATCSNVRFLIAKNECMGNEIKATKE